MENNTPQTRYVDVTAMSRSDFAVALMGAPTGTVMVYHRGSLVFGRQRSLAIKALAEEAWSLWATGWACLTQRRIRGHEGEFEYLAVKRKVIDK